MQYSMDFDAQQQKPLTVEEPAKVLQFPKVVSVKNTINGLMDTKEGQEAILEAARSLLKDQFTSGKGMPVNSELKMADLFRHHLPDFAREHFMVAFFDSQLRLIGTECLFSGTIASAAIYPRVVVQRALELNSHSIALAHNHPSGNPEASRADIEITEHITKALDLVDIEIIDHIIIADNDYQSFKSSGLL